MPSGLLFNGMFRLHIQLTGHLITIISKKIVVEGLHVACYRTTDAGGMGRKDGTDLGQLIVDIECAQTAHPLVGVIDDLRLTVDGSPFDTKRIEALRHQSSSV